jgi:transposase
MSRSAVLSDDLWELIEPLMPFSDGKRSNRFREHRRIVETIVYPFRTGISVAEPVLVGGCAVLGGR